MQIFICDDEKEHIDFFRQVLCEVEETKGYEIEVFFFQNAPELQKELYRRGEALEALPELIFSDIDMPEMNGISLGKMLNEEFPEICLVLLTAYAEFAIEGYETGAYRYLLKPVKAEDLDKILSDVSSRKSQEKQIVLKAGKEDIVLCLKDVLYIGAEDKYLFFHTADKKYMDRNSLGYYEEAFREFGFCRVHRKYLVNLRHHKSIQGYKLVLSNQDVIPISREKRAEYYKLFIKMHEGGCLR